MASHKNYCTECSWSLSTANHSQGEVAGAAIEHHCETDHTITSNNTIKSRSRARSLAW